MPIVTIWATHPIASASGDPGVFTVRRDGPTNAALSVYCRIGGSASNGVDYATIGNWVSIPAGVRTNTVTISPIANGQTNSLNVVLKLAPSPMMPPVNYMIGIPDTAVVYITPSGVSNLPPLVRITSPPNGAVFRAPADVPIYAYAHGSDGSVASVEFFDGTNSLGQGLGLTVTPPMPRYPTNVFWLVWSNAPIGTHQLLAKATDAAGASAVSPPVNIAVLPSPPPPTNRPPLVSVIAADPIAIEGTNCWPWLGLTNRVPTWTNWAVGPSMCRWSTNCGPKNATFVVHRFGATNDDLLVNYDIGGTATNGVDYVPLSGSVTVPAGLRHAEITVVPLDDGPPDLNSTVILRLQPSTNYFLGRPSRAAALIIDSRSSRPGSSSMLPGNCFNLGAAGPDGAWFHVEYSTDLITWTSICTNQVVGGQINFIDPDSSADQNRFYRTVPEAGPPAE